MNHVTRSWQQLTTAERDLVLAQYYSLGAEDGVWERPVDDIIRDLRLAAKAHDFTAFLPTLPSEPPCEVCGGPVALKPMSRTGVKELLRTSPDGTHPPELRRHVHHGQVKPVFYDLNRLAPCLQCGHRPNQPDSCPCRRCKGEQQARARAEQERLRHARRPDWHEQPWSTEQKLERYHQRMHWHLHAETAREGLSVELVPDLVSKARAIFRVAGRIEPDGGLWLRLGSDPNLPVHQQLLFEDEPFDTWTVLATLQAAGIVRLVELSFEPSRDEDSPSTQIPVAVYVLTLDPSEAEELGLLDESTQRLWKREFDAAIYFSLAHLVPEGAEVN